MKPPEKYAAGTPKGKHLIPCDGEAHSNPFIDNCLTCAPRWGWVAVPVEFKTMAEYRERPAQERSTKQGDGR